MRTCAVIPAAGAGSRLGGAVPKLLTPVGGSDTVWTVLDRKLRGIVDHIHVVASPAGRAPIERALRREPRTSASGAREGEVPTSVSVQARPTGMGDAVFCGHHDWQRAQVLLVVWGDQVHVSAETLRRALALHAGAPRRIVLPLVEVEAPYVAYCFDDGGRLRRVLEQREGDACPTRGLSDVGTFVLSTAGLIDAWADHRREQRRGALTGEVNFLPFLVFLANRGWRVLPCPVRDPLEARGINTPSDLDWFRSFYASSDASTAST